MATTTSSVATSTSSITSIETPRLQPLLFPQLAVDGSNYLLWAKTAKAHIHAEELSASIAFDKDSTAGA